MILSAIACIDENNGIGYQGDLLFKNKEDMSFFKRNTLHKPILMGRSTYESIGKPLKGRINIVLTRDKSYNPHPNVLVRHDLLKTLHEFRRVPELILIGGEQLYTQALPYTDRLYLTKVHHSFEHKDTFFPAINEEEWQEYFFKQNTDKKSDYPFTFHAYKRKEL